MSSCHFNFPPRSFSAVYESESPTALDTNKLNGNVQCETCEVAVSPVNSDTRPPTLFGCFHCAFRKSIKVIRKEKLRKDKNAVNNKWKDVA